MTGRGRKGSKSVEESKGESEDKCLNCRKIVREDDDGLQCEVCELWFHSGCQGMTSETYRIINQEGIHWFCKNCDKRVSKLVVTVAKIEERQEKMDEELKETRNELKEVKEDVKKVSQKAEEIDIKLETVIEAKLAKTVEEMETRRPENSNMQGLNRNDVLEEIEINKRRMNVVIIGIKENEDEAEMVKEICTRLVGASAVKSISYIERIGRRSSGKHRLVRVCFSNQQAKFDVLGNASELKKISEFKKLTICPDLTRKQQDQDKLLRNKLKEIRDSGVSDAKIRKGKVVKNDKGVELVLYELPPRQ